MKVFVVTHGEYSDFGISAMFSSKEKAQEYINKRMVYDNGYFGVNQYISEYELDVATIPEVLVGIYTVNTGGISFQERMFHSEDESPSYLDGIDEFICYVHFNPNIGVMKKSVYDQYAQWKALREGV